MLIFRVFLKEHINIERIKSFFHDYYKKDLKRKKLIVFFNLPLSVLFSTGFIFTIIFGVWLLKKNVISMSSFFAFFIILKYIYEPLPKILQFNTSYQEILPILSRINEIVELSSPVKDKPDVHKIKKLNIKISRFGYAHSSKKLLRNIDLTIHPGDCLGIIGKNGTGKTTLVKMLLGLHSLESIYVNDKPLHKIKLNSYLMKIGYSSQFPAIFSGSLEDNLFYSLDSLYRDFKVFLNDSQYSNTIAEEGKNLSGGQKQKINLIRAFCKFPELLVLDEPTVSLDKKSIEQLKDIIKDLFSHRIVIIVSHDESLKNLYTKTLFLN